MADEKGKSKGDGSSHITSHTIEASFTCGHELVIANVHLSRSSPHVDCPYCALKMIMNKILDEPEKYDEEMHEMMELFGPMIEDK